MSRNREWSLCGSTISEFGKNDFTELVEMLILEGCDGPDSLESILVPQGTNKISMSSVRFDTIEVWVFQLQTGESVRIKWHTFDKGCVVSDAAAKTNSIYRIQIGNKYFIKLSSGEVITHYVNSRSSCEYQSGSHILFTRKVYDMGETMKNCDMD